MRIFAEQDKEKYVIGHFAGGLGVTLHSVLKHLEYCEHANKIPVVYWGPDSLYYTPEGLNGFKNAWEYYFEPVSPLSYRDTDIIHCYCVWPNGSNFNYYATSPKKRHLGHALIQKYIKPNALVQSKIDRFYTEYLANKRTIGIHIRGTDKIIEEKPVAASRMVEQALEYADAETQFFIATDEKSIFNELMTLLATRKVVYYECARSEDGAPLHCVSKKRSKSQIAQNGEDMVVEMILFSKCDLFLHTLSSVSAIPLYFNPHLDHILLK